MIALAALRRACACLPLVVATPLIAQEDAPPGVSQVTTHMGGMTMPSESPVEVDDTLVFEPYQGILDMFLRDDVVYLMRHGPTDWSVRDDYEVAPDNCEGQRILSEQGIQDMRNLGAIMAGNKILPAQIVVSEWCRNQQTIDALREGIASVDTDAAEDLPVETDPGLNLLLSLQGAADTVPLEERISAWDGDPDRDGPLMLITHYTNIEELTQFRVFEGEVLVLDPKRDNRVLGYFRLRSASPDEGHFGGDMDTPLLAEDRAADMVTRYYRALNTNDEALLEDVLSDRWVVQGVATDGEPLEQDAFTEELRSFRSALDEPQFTVEDLYVVNDVVTVIGALEGTHVGELFDIEPTGRDVRFSAISVHRFENGEIVETWQMADRFSLLRQITE